MKVAIGHSEDIDEADAIEDVIQQCRDALGDVVPKAGLLYASAEYEHQVLLDAIQAAWPGLPLIGSTTDGELSSTHGHTEDSVVLTLLAGDTLRAHVGVGPRLSEDIGGAVDAALADLPPGERPSLALTSFAPSTDGREVVRAFDERLSTRACPLFGGLSGDHEGETRMFEFANDTILQDSLPVLFLFGPIKHAYGIGSGWQPTGPAFAITDSEGHLLKGIDGQAALDVYGSYYGEVPDGSLGGFPLAIYEDGLDGPWSLRAVIGTDKESGQVRLVGGVRPGSLVRMTEVVQEGVISGTLTSVRQAIASYDGTPEVALLFSCAARKWVLGSSASKEIGTVQKTLAEAGHELPFAGLYAYGEVAPGQPGDPSILHNETCVTLLLGERG